MKYQAPLIKATLLKRYKRFLADAVLEDGSLVTAHCPNTGSMRNCGEKGDVIYLSFHNDPKRKLKYTWELTEVSGGFVCVNTHRPNGVIKEALGLREIPELSKYSEITPEKKRGDSRLDFYLASEGQLPPCWLEVKSVTLLDNNELLFPDSVSKRALKHLKTLEGVVESGERAVLLFLINRPEGFCFKPAKEIDPEYALALKEVQDKGVELLAYRAQNSLVGTSLGEPVPIVL